MIKVCALGQSTRASRLAAPTAALVLPIPVTGCGSKHDRRVVPVPFRAGLDGL